MKKSLCAWAGIGAFAGSSLMLGVAPALASPVDPSAPTGILHPFTGQELLERDFTFDEDEAIRAARTVEAFTRADPNDHYVRLWNFAINFDSMTNTEDLVLHRQQSSSPADIGTEVTFTITATGTPGAEFSFTEDIGDRANHADVGTMLSFSSNVGHVMPHGEELIYTGTFPESGEAVLTYSMLFIALDDGVYEANVCGTSTRTIEVPSGTPTPIGVVERNGELTAFHFGNQAWPEDVAEYIWTFGGRGAPITSVEVCSPLSLPLRVAPVTPPVDTPGVPPVDTPGVPPVTPQVDTPGVPPVTTTDVPPVPLAAVATPGEDGALLAKTGLGESPAGILAAIASGLTALGLGTLLMRRRASTK